MRAPAQEGNLKSRTNWLGIAAVAAAVVCVGLCALIGIGLRYGLDIYKFLEGQSLPKSGSPAPDFTLDTLGGGSIMLSQFRGQPVLLTFSASWCPACREEAPFQQSLHTQHPELVMLLVDSEEPVATVRGFAADFKMSFPVLLDTWGTVYRQYGIFGIPTTFFIDPGGVVRHVLVGGLTAELATQKLPLIGVEP